MGPVLSKHSASFIGFCIDIQKCRMDTSRQTQFIGVFQCIPLQYTVMRCTRYKSRCFEVTYSDARETERNPNFTGTVTYPSGNRLTYSFDRVQDTPQHLLARKIQGCPSPPQLSETAGVCSSCTLELLHQELSATFHS